MRQCNIGSVGTVMMSLANSDSVKQTESTVSNSGLHGLDPALDRTQIDL